MDLPPCRGFEGGRQPGSRVFSLEMTQSHPGSGARGQLPAQLCVGASGCGAGDTGGRGLSWYGLPCSGPADLCVWNGAGPGAGRLLAEFMARWLRPGQGPRKAPPGPGWTWAPWGGCRADRPRGNLAGTWRVPSRRRGRTSGLQLPEQSVAIDVPVLVTPHPPPPAQLILRVCLLEMFSRDSSGFKFWQVPPGSGQDAHSSAQKYRGYRLHATPFPTAAPGPGVGAAGLDPRPSPVTSLRLRH